MYFSLATLTFGLAASAAGSLIKQVHNPKTVHGSVDLQGNRIAQLYGHHQQQQQQQNNEFDSSDATAETKNGAAYSNVNGLSHASTNDAVDQTDGAKLSPAEQIGASIDQQKEATAGRAGATPEKPIYIDFDVDSTIDVPLVPENVFLTFQEKRIFEELVSSIVYAQEAIIKIVPSAAEAFLHSIEQWVKLQKLIPNYRVLRQIHYIRALEALKKALFTLENSLELEKYELDALLKKLLLDNLYLAGFLNDVYEELIIPTYLIDQTGEVIGALIYFIGIDVTRALNFWPHLAGYY